MAINSTPHERTPLTDHEKGTHVHAQPTENKRTLFDLRYPIIGLCIGVLSQGYLMVSCYPYVAFMCIKFIPELTEQSAGVYAGAMSGVMMVGRICSSYAWGWVADEYGRKYVFYYSYLLCVLFSLAFGMSTSMTMAIITRFLLGASDAVVGTVKTVCYEIAEGDKELQEKVMGFVFSMRGYSALISPVIGGYLSDPVKQFPDWYISIHYTDFFTAYPFILPNVVGAAFCLSGFFAVLLGMDETKPQFESDLTRTGNNIDIADQQPKVTLKSIWSKPSTRDHLIAYWGLVYCTQFYAESFPLYFVATKGGLSLQEKEIGLTATAAGLASSLSQYLIYAKMMDKIGLYKVMLAASILGSPLAILTPVASLLNYGAPTGTLNTQTFLYLVICIATVRTFANIYFSTTTLGANRSVTKEERSAMNSLSMLGGSVSQALAPFLAGLLTTFALSSGIFDPNVGIYLIFSVVTGVGLCLTMFTLCQLKKYYKE